MQLFSHIAEYLHAGLRCIAKQPSDMLAAEMWSSRGVKDTEKFLSSNDVSTVMTEVERLGKGDVKSEWFTHIENQRTVSRADRNRQLAFSQSDLSLNEEFRRVAPSDFDRWIRVNTNSQLGRDALTQQLVWQFPEESRLDLAQYSNFLLQNDCRVACGIVRSVIYYNWRCVHRGSNPPDLLDDMYHVLSAPYCDIYATEEIKQKEYACTILQGPTQVHIYQRGERLDDWLLEITRRFGT